MPKSALSLVAPVATQRQTGEALPPTIAVEQWCRGNSYRGTAADLIAAGLVRSDQLPGAPGNGISRVTFYKGERIPRGVTRYRFLDEHYMCVSKRGRGTFEVEVGVTEAVRKVREDAKRALETKERRELEWRNEQERAAREAARLADPENLRSGVDVMLTILSHVIRKHAPGDLQMGTPDFPWRFCEEGIDDAMDALDELRGWLKRATFDPIDMAPIKAQAARKDKAFQSFLRSQCLKG